MKNAKFGPIHQNIFDLPKKLLISCLLLENLESRIVAAYWSKLGKKIILLGKKILSSKSMNNSLFENSSIYNAL